MLFTKFTCKQWCHSNFRFTGTMDQQRTVFEKFHPSSYRNDAAIYRCARTGAYRLNDSAGYRLYPHTYTFIQQQITMLSPTLEQELCIKYFSSARCTRDVYWTVDTKPYWRLDPSDQTKIKTLHVTSTLLYSPSGQHNRPDL